MRTAKNLFVSFSTNHNILIHYEFATQQVGLKTVNPFTGSAANPDRLNPADFKSAFHGYGSQ
jgi:hypothetical protein